MGAAVFKRGSKIDDSGTRWHLGLAISPSLRVSFALACVPDGRSCGFMHVRHLPGGGGGRDSGVWGVLEQDTDVARDAERSPQARSDHDDVVGGHPGEATSTLF